MNIDRKLKLNVLVVLSLLTVIVGTAIYYFERIGRDVRQRTEIEEPLQHTILEMETNVVETARAVQHYIRDLERRDLESIKDAKLDFDRFAIAFLRLAKTEQERVLGQQVIEQYRKFKIMGDKITSMAKRRFGDLATFKQDVAKIHALIDGKILPAIDRSAADGMTKTHATREMQIYIFETFAAIEGYILTPTPSSKKAIAETEADFKRLDAQYRATSMSARETQWLAQVAITFADAVGLGNKIIALTDSLIESLTAYEASLTEINRILDEEFQVLMLAEAQRAAKGTEVSSQFAVAVIAGLGIVIFTIMASVNWVVLRGIVAGVARLSQGVAAFGAGRLDHRIDTSATDELGMLAGALNKMADRRRADEMALVDAEQRITAIVDHIFDGIVTIDAAGIIQWTNRSALEIFGYTSGELIGRNIKILVPEPFASEHDSYIRNYQDTGEAKIIGTGREVEGRRRDGGTFPMELQIAEIEFKGEQLFLGVTRDISERREMDRIKSEFVSTVSHELRTPLTSIRGSLGLVCSGAFGELPQKAARMVELGKKNTERLITLVNDLLDMEKLQSGEMEFYMSKASLIEIVTDAIQANRPYAQEQKVSFELTRTTPDAFVLGDNGRLAQVMTNLLSNAAKYSPEGGTVEIALTRRDGGYRVAISDRGPGVPEAFKDRIFERFTQADATDTRQKGGTGLGLSISRFIVQKHGGVIDFESEPGNGATFYIDLPQFDIAPPSPVARCAGGAAKDIPVVAESAATCREEVLTPARGVMDWLKKPVDENSLIRTIERGTKSGAGGRRQILIVEDDADLTEFLVQLIGGLADVTVVGTVARARHALVSAQWALVILDIELPDGSGMDLIPLLKCGERPPVPVILFTAEEVGNEIASEVEYALVKSRTSNEDLLATISAMISKPGEIVS